LILSAELEETGTSSTNNSYNL